MNAIKEVTLFEGREIRREWNSKKEKWYFSVIDVIQILTNSSIPRRYWSDLKVQLGKEGSQLYDKIVQLKLRASDGKYYLTDTADIETMFRIIQSVPSPKAEPVKLWLSQLGRERLEEIQNPELAMDRAKSIYERKGYKREWIDKRMRGINVRHTLTDEWKNRGVKKGQEFAILTDEIYKGTFEMTSKEYKKHKSLEKENNLRDHMSDIELILTMLGEATTAKISQDKDSHGFNKLKEDAEIGGAVAGRTRKDIEEKAGKKLISKDNFLPNEKSKLS